jgi:hypothetical protein
MKINKIYKNFLNNDYKKLWDLITKEKLEILSIINKNNEKKKTAIIIKYHGRLQRFNDYIIVIGSEGIEYGKHLYDNFEEFEKDCKRLELEFFDVENKESKKKKDKEKEIENGIEKLEIELQEVKNIPFNPELLGFEIVSSSCFFISYRKDFLHIRKFINPVNLFHFSFLKPDGTMIFTLPIEIKEHGFGVKLVESILNAILLRIIE